MRIVFILHYILYILTCIYTNSNNTLKRAAALKTRTGDGGEGEDGGGMADGGEGAGLDLSNSTLKRLAFLTPSGRLSIESTSASVMGGEWRRWRWTRNSETTCTAV